MNGTINSKNFKVTFTVSKSGLLNEATIAGTGSESKKYFKTITTYAPGDLITAVTQLNELETGLRAFVLARIGG